jgi:hypothetical protein
MSFFTRLTNGWKICLNNFIILKENKRLLFFPILSCISLLLVFGSFIILFLTSPGWRLESIRQKGFGFYFAILFGYYLVNYFILLFFNTALMYCSRAYFKGEKMSIAKGLRFGLSRISAIFSWALFAATIGVVLRTIQQNAGFLGRILTGSIGIVWSIATFFVVPLIACENAGLVKAFKRSSEMMKEKWGETMGTTFSFGVIQFIAILLVATPMFIIGFLINFYLGLFLAALTSFFVMAILGATQIIFVSAVYHNVSGIPSKHFNFNRQIPRRLFIHK